MPNSLGLTPQYSGNSTFSLSVRRSTLVGIAFSLVLHMALIVLVWPELKKTLSERPAPGPMSARLRINSKSAPKAAPQPAPEPPQPEAQATPPSPPHETPRPRRSPPRRQTAPPVITRREPSPNQAQIRPATPLPPPFPTPREDSSPDTDMMANLDAKRAERSVQQRSAQSDPDEASGNRQKSEDELAMARIAQNLKPKQDGASGVFTIRNLGIRSAELYFAGWRGDRGRVIAETFEIDAGIGGDVQLAVIRKIIQLIRRDYSGNFNWDSYRLRKVVILSARPQDSAELESFLRAEFAEVFARAR